MDESKRDEMRSDRMDADRTLLLEINRKIDVLLLGKKGVHIDTPANRKADIDAVVLRFTQRKKRLKKDA